MKNLLSKQKAMRARLLSFVAAVVMIPLFQNCGSFEATKFASSNLAAAYDPNAGSPGGSAGGSTLPPGVIPDPSSDGIALYGSNCAVCHGPLATSTKLGRSVISIQNAIQEVSTMKAQISLTSLTQTQLLAIEAALNGRAPSTPPMSGGPVQRRLRFRSRP